jgi:peptidoglycan/xylan/chitin deacetylase (PgdA/CDA1 family)
VTVYFTVDVEEDCPPFLHTWRGMERGLPRLLDVLADERVPATLFTTGEVARRFPAQIRAAVTAGHELGCHSNTHGRYTDMTADEADADIALASRTLRDIAPVVSFRAPYLQFPRPFVPLLAKHGYALDSSQGRHKAFGIRAHRDGAIVRVPASVSSLTLRWPRSVRDALFARLNEPIVLFCHPWEFVDLRREPIRWDCRLWTGDRALDAARSTIRYFKARGASFGLMRDCVAA